MLIVFMILLLGKTVLVKAAFGAEYASAYVPLVILASDKLVSVSAGSVSSLLNMTGHERDTMKGLMIAAPMNLVLNFPDSTVGSNGRGGRDRHDSDRLESHLAAQGTNQDRYQTVRIL